MDGAAAPGCTASSHLAAGSPVPGTERVAGLIPGYLLLRRPFDLAGPGSLHSVGRHQDPSVPQRVVTQVLVFCIKTSSFTKLHVLISTSSASTCFTSASRSDRTRIKLEFSLLKHHFCPFSTRQVNISSSFKDTVIRHIRDTASDLFDRNCVKIIITRNCNGMLDLSC